MTIVQTFRSWTTGNRPPAGRPVGELYVNFADNQLGAVNTNSVNQDLLGVRLWSAVCQYYAGDHAYGDGTIWRASVNPTYGLEPWNNPSQWSRVVYEFDAAGYLPLTGGTITGALQVDAWVQALSWLNVPNAPAYFMNSMFIQYDGTNAYNELYLGDGMYLFFNGQNGQIYLDNNGQTGRLDGGGNWFINGGLYASVAQAGNDFLLGQSGPNRVLFWSAGGGYNMYWNTQNGYLYYTMGNYNAAWLGPGATGAFFAGPIYGTDGQGGQIRCASGSGNVSFDWDGSQPWIRVDGGGYSSRICTSYNTRNLNYNGGVLWSPTGVSLNGQDNAGNVFVTYCDTNSDERIKENIIPTKVDALGVLYKLDVDEFDIKADVAAWFASVGDTPEERAEKMRNAQPAHVPIGIVAQKVQRLIPDGVHTNPQTRETMPAGCPIPDHALTLNNQAFTPYLIRAIQQLDEKIAVLEAKLATLGVT